MKSCCKKRLEVLTKHYKTRQISGKRKSLDINFFSCNECNNTYLKEGDSYVLLG